MLIELQQKREGMAKRLRCYNEELERVKGWIDTEEYAIKAIDAEIANAKKVQDLESGIPVLKSITTKLQHLNEDLWDEAKEVVEDERKARTNNGEGM